MDVFSCSLYLCLIILVLIQAYKSYYRFERDKNLAPGPKPFPIIGNLLELGDKPHKSLAKLSKSYGPIMHLKLGQVSTVVISSAAMAKEVLQTNDRLFSNRTVPDAISAVKHNEFGMPWLPVSPTWRNLRKICNSHLFSAKVLDAYMNIRQHKIQDLLSDVGKSAQEGKAVEIGKAAFKTSLNLLSTTFFSMDLTDPTSDIVREFRDTVWHIVEEAGKPNLADFFPVLKIFDPQGSRRRTTIYFRKIMDLFGRIINQRLQQSSVEENDILDSLIKMMVSEDNSEHKLDRTTIEHLLLDLFGAGTETTAATFEWAMAEVLKAPDVMRKAQAELDRVIGKGNQVQESDINRLPYLQAILKETFRLHQAVPFLVPRNAGTDVKLNGYVVPKGAQVLVNVWTISRDSTIWENPEKFMPERFLGSNVDVRGQDFQLTPFGGGRRICPGLPLAIRMLYLMLGSLLHSFDWMLEDGVTPETMNMEDRFGITLQMAQPLRAIPISKNA